MPPDGTCADSAADANPSGSAASQHHFQMTNIAVNCLPVAAGPTRRSVFGHRFDGYATYVLWFRATRIRAGDGACVAGGASVGADAR